MTTRNTRGNFPYLPDYMSFHDWNGNFIIWYGQEPIPHNDELNWTETAKHIMSLPTFAAYPTADPDRFDNWQDWARAITEIINGPSR